MSIEFNCTALIGTNKAGVLKPDENGYYPIVLGALAVENSSGEYYSFDDEVKSLFGQGSSLIKRINKGVCRSELGHPKRTPGMTDRDYVRRILTIEETNTSAHIKSVKLENNLIKDEHGNYVLATMGMVKPAGPQMQQLEEGFKNPDENIAFSIRSLTENKIRNGRLEKKLRTIVNWDQVNEGGIATAHKYATPSLESFKDDSCIILPEHIELLEEGQGNVSLESSGIDTTMIRTELGWTKVQLLRTRSIHEW